MQNKNIRELTFEELSNYKNNSGYIALDQIIDEQGEDEIRGTTTEIKKWFDCKDGRVLVKSDNPEIENAAYSELISCELANQAKMPTAKYDVMEYKGQRGLITKNICNGREELISIHELIGEVTNNEDFPDKTDIYELFDKLEIKFQQMGMTDEQTYTNMLDLRKQLLFDICIMETDRHTENISYIFSTDENGQQVVRISPLYDTELALGICDKQDVMEKISSDILKLSATTSIQEPRICVIPEDLDNEEVEEDTIDTFNMFIKNLKASVKANSNDGLQSEDIWKGTLDFLCEDEEARNYLESLLNNMNIYKAVDDVEKKHSIVIPDYVKNMASRCFEDRIAAIKWEMGIEENEKNNIEGTIQDKEVDII